MQPDPSGRLQVVQAPPTLPGSCAICGTAQHEQGFIDPQLFIEWHGGIYFCWSCVSEMASIFDFIDPEKGKQLIAKIEEQQATILRLSADKHHLEKALEHLNSLSNGNGAEPVSVTEPEPVPDENTDDVTAEADKLLAEISSGQGSDNPDADEPSVSEGSDDATDAASSDESLASLGL